MSARERSRTPHGQDEVTNLVFQREQARMAKDWNLADTLRDQLQQLGVTLFDKTNSWKSSDGRTGRIPTFTEVEGGQPIEAFAPGDILGSADDDPVVTQIKQLVQEREQARAQKDFAKSDQIRDQLKSMGVDLQDKEKMWRASSGQAGIIIGYRGAAGPTDVEINTLVIQRERARQSNDYATADMIRDELKPFGIEIHDKEKVWRAPDGRSGQVPSWQVISGGADPGPLPSAAWGGQPPGPGRMQYSSPSDLQAQVVQAALEASQDPRCAERVLLLLRQEIRAQGGGGQLPQASRVMQPAPPQRGMMAAQRGALPRNAANSPEAQEAFNFINQCEASGRLAADSEIEWLVGIREKIRQNKDYAASDGIRDAMKAQLGVQLLEKEKRWTSNDGRQGVIPMWTSMA